MTWIQTRSGVAFDLLAPRAADVRIDDIAYALAGLNRYTGHSRLTVAEHSIHVAHVCEAMMLRTTPGPHQPWIRAFRLGLLHDAHEAYVGDVSSPLKMAMRAEGSHAFPPPYESITDRVDAVIWPGLGIEPPNEAELRMIKAADRHVLLAEKETLGKEAKPWDVPHVPECDGIKVSIALLDPRDAERTFLQRWLR